MASGTIKEEEKEEADALARNFGPEQIRMISARMQ
jgi:hypothetical protein